MSLDRRLREGLQRSSSGIEERQVDLLIAGIVTGARRRRRMRRAVAVAGVLALALAAAFAAPKAFDAIRNLDRQTPLGPHRVGLITTVAGNGEPGSSGDGGPATKARLSFPVDLGFDGEGNLYILDLGNPSNPGRVRKVDRFGNISTVVGRGAPGEATRVVLGRTFGATGLAVDLNGNVFVAGGDGNYTNHQVIRVDPSGDVTVIAGTLGFAGHSGDGGPAVNATLETPWDVAVDLSGNVYISVGNRIRKVDTSGVITTIAGTGVKGFSGDGGPATEAQVARPSGVAVDEAGNVYFIDQGNGRIRRIDTHGTITTVAGPGEGSGCFSGDGGPATEAQFCGPEHLWVDSHGNLYIADTYNRRVRKIDTNEIITTVAGNGEAGPAHDGVRATNETLSKISGVAIGPDGALYVADSGHNRVRKVVL
jgi:trimeric autotransporter adhesin